MYCYRNNVLSDELIDSLNAKYARVLDTDLSSYDIWPKEATQDNSLPESFATNIEGAERMAIIDYLYSNADSPFYKDKRVRASRIAVQKLLDSGSIPVHTDTCVASMTLFLNKDNIGGGEFFWIDDDGFEHCVVPKYNKGIFTIAETSVTTLFHGVKQVTGHNRYTLQLFIWEHEKNNIEFGDNE
jgi:hypothetical protein